MREFESGNDLKRGVLGMHRSNIVQADVDAAEENVSLTYFNCQYGWHESCMYLDDVVLDPERSYSTKKLGREY